jgi:hypothetical protein
MAAIDIHNRIPGELANRARSVEVTQKYGGVG